GSEGRSDDENGLVDHLSFTGAGTDAGTGTGTGALGLLPQLPDDDVPHHANRLHRAELDWRIEGRRDLCARGPAERLGARAARLRRTGERAATGPGPGPGRPGRDRRSLDRLLPLPMDAERGAGSRPAPAVRLASAGLPARRPAAERTAPGARKGPARR